MKSLKITNCPSAQDALTNCVFVSENDFKTLNSEYILFRDFVFSPKGHSKIKDGYLGLGSIQRRTCQLSLNEAVNVVPFPSDTIESISALTFELDFLTRKKSGDPIDVTHLQKLMLNTYLNQIFTSDQRMIIDFVGFNLTLRVSSIETCQINEKGEVTQVGSSSRGILNKITEISFEKAPGSTIKLTGGSSGGGSTIFRPDWNFESMGIGGLRKEFNDIFRRAFASRVFPPVIMQRMGVKHVKGILLYGPPGTGKTLMARQIGKMLNGKEPKVVAGPEILNKFVGQSEENIRELFKDAEEEYRERGEESDLHIIIFDELDAICRQRGARTDGTGVGDTVVNQILTKIDGVESINNILVIGMTNRKDMIDEALLRAGRMEVHLEIGLPDEAGRLQIFRIHTNQMAKNGFLDPGIDLGKLAKSTKNFSGAEIEGLVKSARSFALNRQIDPDNLLKPSHPEDIIVLPEDFEFALQEVRPAFGVSDEDLGKCLSLGMIDYGLAYSQLVDRLKFVCNHIAQQKKTQIFSILLQGNSGSGKTALASKIAIESGFPFVKLVSPDSYTNMQEGIKRNRIATVFEDAYKSGLSLLVVDNIERLIEYVRVGPRFSNNILQDLLVFLKRPPPQNRKLLVIATSGSGDVMNMLEIDQCFSMILNVPDISEPADAKKVLGDLNLFKDANLDAAEKIFAESNKQIPIRKFYALNEMLAQFAGNPELQLSEFKEFLSSK